MKRFACGDVVPGCKASWAEVTDGELLKVIAEHAAEVHGLTDIPPSLVEEIRSKISADA